MWPVRAASPSKQALSYCCCCWCCYPNYRAYAQLDQLLPGDMEAQYQLKFLIQAMALRSLASQAQRECHSLSCLPATAPLAVTNDKKVIIATKDRLVIPCRIKL